MTKMGLLPALLLVLVTTAFGIEFNYSYPEDNETEVEQYHLYNFTLPGDLLIGAASAAYQYEGAWNEGGKSFVLNFYL